MQRKLKKILQISFVAAVGLALVAAILVGIFVSQNNSAGFDIKTPAFFDKDWRVDGANQQISLPIKLKIEANTKVAISNILPQITQDNNSLLLRTTDQNIKVFVGEKEIYSYGYGDKTIFKTAESAWHLVELSEEYSGKEIKILTVTAYGHFSGTFNSVMMGSKAENVFFVLKSNAFPFLLSVLFIIVAIVLLIVGALCYKSKLRLKEALYLGVLSLTIGLWSISESKMLQLFITNTYLYTMICHFGLMLGMLSYCMFILTTSNKNFCKVRYWGVLTAAAALNVLVQTVLQVTGLVDFEQMLFITQILLVITAASSATAQLYLFIKKRTKETFLIFLSILIFGFMVGLDVLFFYNGIFAYNMHFTRLGLLVFILLLAYISINNYIQEYIEAVELKDQLNIANTSILLSQIKPHFLYNALNSIKGLCILEPEKAADAIQDFSTYLRANMGSIEAKKPIPFNQELKQIESYLSIEKLRFGKKLNIVYDIACKDFLVPALSVEPFVENAIVHGVLKNINGGTVKIKTYETKDNFVAEIEDDGVGFDVKIIEGSERVGIRNTILRLKVISKAGVKIVSRTGQTIVKVEFPKLNG